LRRNETHFWLVFLSPVESPETRRVARRSQYALEAIHQTSETGDPESRRREARKEARTTSWPAGP
jgi:hypothetical protein